MENVAFDDSFVLVIILFICWRRFGSALVFEAPGELNLRKAVYEEDFSPIDSTCPCPTCASYTRAYLHTIVTKEPSACHLVSVHNVCHQLRLMTRLRDAVIEDTLPAFIQGFMAGMFPDKLYPGWAVNALVSVGVTLL